MGRGWGSQAEGQKACQSGGCCKSAAKAGPLGWEGGAGWPGAGALRTLKAGCLAGASHLSNKQSTTLFKTEGRAGDWPDHLISISPPQGSAGSYLKGPEDQWVGSSARDQAGTTGALHAEITGGPPSGWICRARVLPTDSLFTGILTTEGGP